MEKNNCLSQNLKKAREHANLTQEQVASQLHISRQAISKWENGKGTPDIYLLKNLSSLYGVSIDELVENTTITSSKISNNIFEPNNIIEALGFVLLSALSINLPIVGILIPISILIYTYKKNKINKIIIISSLICISIEFYHSFVILNHYFFNLGTSTIEPL